MYRSVLDQRLEPIDPQAFEAAPNLVFNHYAAGEKADEYSLGLWDRLVPYTPEQIYNLFAGGYDQDNIVVDIKAFETGKVTFEIEHDEDAAFISRLQLNLGVKTQVYSSKVVVDPDSQGQGIGRMSMRNWIETAAAFGFPEFSFDAAMDDGGYVWAKMGAHLDRNIERQPFYEDEEEALSRSLNARLEAARPFIEQASYEQARVLCQIRKPDDLVRLSAMGDILVPREAVDEAMSAVPQFFMNVLNDTRECARAVKAELANLSSVFHNVGQGACEYVSLPAFLKKKTVWAGVVDFADVAQMERVGDYLCGWRTMEPVTP